MKFRLVTTKIFEIPIGAQFMGNSYYGWGTGRKLIDYVNCVGTENSLLNCQYSKALTNLCSHSRLAGVVCQSELINFNENEFKNYTGGGSCKNHDIRLITAASLYRSYGRIEYCLNNEWGNVCDDGWDSSDCRVACKQLGFDGKPDSIYVHFMYIM